MTAQVGMQAAQRTLVTIGVAARSGRGGEERRRRPIEGPLALLECCWLVVYPSVKSRQVKSDLVLGSWPPETFERLPYGRLPQEGLDLTRPLYRRRSSHCFCSRRKRSLRRCLRSSLHPRRAPPPSPQTSSPCSQPTACSTISRCVLTRTR